MIRLKRATVEDVRFCVRVRNESRECFFKTGRVTEKGQRKFMAAQDHFYIGWLDGERIGTVGIYNIELGSAEIGRTTVAVEYRRKGYGLEMNRVAVQIAFNVGVDVVYAKIRTENDAAIRMYGKLGFKIMFDEADVVTMAVENPE